MNSARWSADLADATRSAPGSIGSDDLGVESLRKGKTQPIAQAESGRAIEHQAGPLSVLSGDWLDPYAPGIQQGTDD